MLFLRQLAPCIGRIEFTFVWDHSFASDNSPPHIAATQYSLATHLERVFRWTQTFTGWFHGFISVRRATLRRSREALWASVHRRLRGTAALQVSIDQRCHGRLPMLADSLEGYAPS